MLTTTGHSTISTDSRDGCRVLEMDGARTMVKSRRVLRVAAILAMALLMISSVAQSGGQMSAAPLSAPVNQCNNDTASNVGGQGLSCTVTVVNNVDGSGNATAASTVTVTKCVGAAGPIAAGAGTCATTVSTSPAPVTSVTQCDGSANGGGGVLICTVTITNNIAGSVTPTPATVYQCIGSVITGTGAPGTCTPVNTPGITSVTAATVGQCNNSGNGGTSVSFICNVSVGSTMSSAFAMNVDPVSVGSTMSSALAVNVDQCNGSANGGGSLVRCTATVNSVVTAASTPAPATPAPPTATPAPTVAPVTTPAPTAAPVTTPAPTAAPVAIVAPTATPTPPTAVLPAATLPSTSTADTSVPFGLVGLLLVALGALLVRSRRTVPTKH